MVFLLAIPATKSAKLESEIVPHSKTASSTHWLWHPAISHYPKHSKHARADWRSPARPQLCRQKLQPESIQALSFFRDLGIDGL